MTFEFARTLSMQMLAWTMFLQGLEMYLCSRRKWFRSIWGFRNLAADLERGLPLPRPLIWIFFNDDAFKHIAIVQMLSAVIAFSMPGSLPFGILFCTHLLFCIRFRGTFNGGSDMMTFVVLTGVLLSLVLPETSLKFGLVYICVHALFSYFRAGTGKLKEAKWRDGTALAIFLSRSLYPDMQKLAAQLRPMNWLCVVMSWGVMVFELSVIALPLAPNSAIVYFEALLLFHFCVYRAFGLNRFFWIWLSAWPSIFYTVGLFSA